MSKWTIYRGNGEVLHESVTNYDGNGRIVEQDTLEYSGKWMGDCFITVSFKSAYPIDFQIGDYIIYRGERFTINYDPTVVKKSSRGTYGEGFTYDSVKFNALSNELTDAKFHDWVLSDNKIHYSSLPNFSFYAKDMNDLADRLQACMDRWCKDNGFAKENYWIFYTPGSGEDTNPYDRTIQRAKDISTDETFLSNILKRWKEIYGDTGTQTERKDERLDRTVSIDNQTVWQGMALFKSRFGLNFIVRGREVIIGAAGVFASHIFKYGKDNGLYEVDKQADTDQKVVTRLHAYGSSDNLPTRYYAELDMKVSGHVEDVYWQANHDITASTGGGTGWSTAYLTEFSLDIPYKPAMFNKPTYEDGINESKYEEPFGYFVRVSIEGGPTLNACVHSNSYGKDDTAKARACVEVRYNANGSTVKAFEWQNTDNDAFKKFSDLVTKGKKITFESGVDKDKAPVEAQDYNGTKLPDNMAVMNLMLPGFPKYALSELCGSTYDEASDTTSYSIKNPYTNTTTVFHTEPGKHVVKYSSDQYDPYIVSQNAEALGYRDDDIFCTEENDDNGLKKVYPSVEEVKESEAGVSSSDEYINTVVSADVVEDNGVFPNKETTKIPGFTITIKNLGFDLRAAISAAGGDSCKISMKDGFCGGREFDVPSVEHNADGTWTLHCKRAQDSSLDIWFPYSYDKSIGNAPGASTNAYQVCKGDHYVLLGISLDETNYVWAASVKLLAKAIHWLCKNDYSRYTYSPKIDEIYMARQDEEAKASGGKTKSLHDTLKEGDLLWFQDDDLRLDGKVYIDQLVIKENGNNGIPTYDVTLRNEIQVGTIQRIQNKVDSIANDIRSGNVGGGVSPSGVESIVNAVGEKKFLSKTRNDSTPHKLTMGEAEVKGDATVGGDAKSSDYTHTGFPFGKGWAAMKDDGHGASMLEVDKLFVRMKAYFAELEIRKISYLGGNYVFSSAGGTIYYVEWLDIHDKVLEKTEGNRDLVYTFRCYLYSDDGTTKMMNWFQEDDQVRCQNFGINTETKKVVNGVITAADRTTHYWWRRVRGVGSGVIAAKGDGKNYEYVDFQNDEGQYGADSDFPVEGDAMVQFGNWTNPNRQGVIMIVVTGDDAPAIIEWQNVGANNQHFVMPAKEYSRISPRGEGNIFRGKFISVNEVDGYKGMSVDEIFSALLDKIKDIEQQADKKFEMWFGSGAPHPLKGEDYSTANSPASDWATEAERNLHLQDLYYDTEKDPASDGGRAWRWQSATANNATSWYWEEVTDQDTIEALEKARDLQNQVDDISSDSVISAGSEKTRLLLEWYSAIANYKKYWEQANDYKLTESCKNLYKAFFVLATMLNNGTPYTETDCTNETVPSWIDKDFTVDTYLSEYVANSNTQGVPTSSYSKEQYKANWKEFYNQLAAVLKDIKDAAAAATQKAQKTADAAVTSIEEICNDNILDASEKQTLKRDFVAFWHEMYDPDGLEDKGKDANGSFYTSSIATAFKGVVDSFQAVGAFLNDGRRWSAPTALSDEVMPAWLKDENITKASPVIVGSSFVSLWSDMYAKRTAYLTLLSEYARQTADKAQDTADKKVQTFISRTVPETPYDSGDMWVNTADNNNLLISMQSRLTEQGTTYPEDWFDLSTIYDKNDPRMVLAAMAEKVYEISGGSLEGRGSIKVYLNLDYLPNGNEGDIALIGNSVSRHSLEWVDLNNSSYVDTFKSVYNALGAVTITIYSAIPSTSAIEHDLVLRTISWHDPFKNDNVKGNIEILMYNGSSWEMLRESTKAIIENLGDEIREVVFGSDGEGGTLSSGMMTLKGMSNVMTRWFKENGDLVDNGLLTTDKASTLYSKLVDADGKIVSEANVSTYVTKDKNGVLESGVTINANKINFIGMTIINEKFWVDVNGVVYMNEANVSGTINATSGKIAGFSISGNGLVNTGFNNDAYVLFRNDTYNTFAGIGGNVLPLSSGMRAVARFENHDKTNQWGLGYNVAVIMSAMNSDYNLAFAGNGNGFLDGYIAGFGFQEKTCDKENTCFILHPKESLLFIVDVTKQKASIGLPSLSEIRMMLGVGENDEFAVPIEIIIKTCPDDDHGGTFIYGKNDRVKGMNTDYYPVADWDQDWRMEKMGNYTNANFFRSGYNKFILSYRNSIYSAYSVVSTLYKDFQYVEAGN